MAAAPLAQACIEPLDANGADIVDRDEELIGFSARVRTNHVRQPRVRGKLRWFTIGQRVRIKPQEATVALRGTATVSRIASRLRP